MSELDKDDNNSLTKKSPFLEKFVCRAYQVTFYKKTIHIWYESFLTMKNQTNAYSFSTKLNSNVYSRWAENGAPISVNGIWHIWEISLRFRKICDFLSYFKECDILNILYPQLAIAKIPKGFC